MLSVLSLLAIVTVQKCYTFIPVTTCSTTFYKKSGTFSSPTFYEPNNTNTQTCKWRILASPDERIVLNVTQMNIEKTPSCTSGHVEVRDGYWEDSPLLGKYCGDGVLNPIISTSNKMLISYEHKAGYRGFLATHEAICGKHLYVRNETVLHSNELQEKYPLNRKCIWKMIVPEQHRVVASFKTFQLEYQNRCLFDYVEFYDSNSTSLGRFCGAVLPHNITSISNTLTMKFVSDASVQKEGFSLHVVADYDECITKEHECAQECINTVGSYRCACRSGYELVTDGKSCELVCGGILNSSIGTIHSPSFPHEYPPNKTCIWEIVAPVDYVIHLNFTHFDVEGANMTHSIREKCVKDKLELFSEKENVTTRLGTYCGSVLPDVVVSEGSTMKIVWSSDNTVQRTGFALNYSIVADTCDKYGGNCQHQCVSLKTQRKCICSNNYISVNNIDCKKGSCQYEIASSSGTILSTNYPYNYLNDQNCTWRFRTTPGHRIQLTFHTLRTEECRDYVDIYDGFSSNAPSLGRLCGNKTGVNKTSTSNELYVNFISDGWNYRQGFKATYLSTCGSTSTATVTKQYIFSHDTYGLSNYDRNAHCVWTIRPSSGNKTSLFVEVLDLESSRICAYDFLEIVDGGTSRGKFCDKKPLNEFVSGEMFTITFRTDYSENRKGFRLMYKAVP